MPTLKYYQNCTNGHACVFNSDWLIQNLQLLQRFLFYCSYKYYKGIVIVRNGYHLRKGDV